MSAFVVDPAHIDALLSVAINGPTDRRSRDHIGWQPPYVLELLGRPEPLGPSNADAAGAELLRECISSVRYRYPDDGDSLPGPSPVPVPEQYEWTDFGTLMTAIECCKAISCFEYQSCEHPVWVYSGSRRFCSALRAGMTSTMQGYDEAPWTWDVERVLVRARGR